MNDRQNAFFQMAAAVKVVADTYNSSWVSTHSFATPYELLNTSVLDKLPAAVAMQGTTSTGVTADKKVLRNALVAHLSSLAGAVEAYATTVGNGTLGHQAHITPSDARNASDDELLGMEKRISDLATANMAALSPYGVTTARITALDLDATNFSAMMGKPRATRAFSKDGTGQIDSLMILGRSYLESMDVQMILFKDSAPDFYSQYFTARMMLPTGGRPRAIYFSVSDNAGHPIPGATIEINILNIKKVTSANGNCFVQNAAPGSYGVVCSKFGYTEVLATANVNDGETDHVAIQMVATA